MHKLKSTGGGCMQIIDVMVVCGVIIASAVYFARHSIAPAATPPSPRQK